MTSIEVITTDFVTFRSSSIVRRRRPPALRVDARDIDEDDHGRRDRDRKGEDTPSPDTSSHGRPKEIEPDTPSTPSSVSRQTRTVSATTALAQTKQQPTTLATLTRSNPPPKVTSAASARTTTTRNPQSSGYLGGKMTATTKTITETTGLGANPTGAAVADTRGLVTGRPQHVHLSPLVEGVIITFIAIGALAIVTILILFLRRRRRVKRRLMRLQSQDEPDPRETRMTTTTDSTGLFASDPNAPRPTTVSTRPTPSRAQAPNGIAPPMPSDNPFRDPPLQRTYDILRGKRRGTTGVRRERSWIRNPFTDPTSKRYDPFGEIRGRMERERR